MGENPGAKIQPPLLSGHGLETSGQVVLGTSTLESLHKSIGGTVVVSSHGLKPTTLRIVGTATLPSYGQSSGSHMEMGVGAVLNYTLIPLFERDIFDLPRPQRDPHPLPIGRERLPGSKVPPTRRRRGRWWRGQLPRQPHQHGRTTGRDRGLPLARYDARSARRRPCRRRARGTRPDVALFGSPTSSRHCAAQSTRILPSSGRHDSRRSIHHRRRTRRSHRTAPRDRRWSNAVERLRDVNPRGPTRGRPHLNDIDRRRRGTRAGQRDRCTPGSSRGPNVAGHTPTSRVILATRRGCRPPK